MAPIRDVVAAHAGGPTGMNYNHLYYFWVVAREGSITRATARLHLTQPTISGQLKTLEQEIGQRLFERRGRSLALTDVGQLVYRYADEMFSTGHELLETLQGHRADHPRRFTVGISDALPKLTTYRLLRPALQVPEPMQLVCRIDKTDRLVGALSLHDLDVVLADAPVPPGLGVRLFNHALGECDVTVFATEELAAQYRRGFPQSLDGAPVILQTGNTALRRSLDQWFASAGLRPRIAAEVEDVALLQVLGQHGMGLFAAPTVVANDIRRAYGVKSLGRLPDVRERFFAITAQRQIAHPAVAALTDAARRTLAAAGDA